MGMVIDLAGGCTDPKCLQRAAEMRSSMVSGGLTEGLAILPIPADIDEYVAGQERRQLRQRANRAEKLGYTFGEIQPSALADDIHEINCSMPERQGRPMSKHYVQRRNLPTVSAPTCPRHHTYWYGVAREGKLLAYSSWHRVGELLQTSVWIGHGDFNQDGIMYFMQREVMRAQDDGYAMYAFYDAGGIAWNGGGLRQWKKQVGYTKQDVEWA